MITRVGFARLAVIVGVAFALASPLAPTAAAADDGGHPGGEAAGNNLSFPVIWSDGVGKDLRGVYGELNLNGAMWYWWGTDTDGNPDSCLADPDDTDYCNDGEVGTVGPAPCNDRGDPDCMAVFAQQDSNSDWQAESADWSGAPVSVHWIDWGDNLESVDWYTRSKVRAEIVLVQDLAAPMVQYGIRHLSGWGIDELWGLATDGVSWDPNPDDELDETVYYTSAEVLAGMQATVYSDCARLTIQKLTKPRGDPSLVLTWNPTLGEWEGDVTDGDEPALFNKPVWESGDGPGYYSAEINVKGKVIYGYTWDVKSLNDPTQVDPYTHPTAAGDYRITFSLDASCPAGLNTFFDASTQIILPLEEEEASEVKEEDGTGGGAVGVVDSDYNLTYMDVRILERSGGKKK